MKNNKMLPEAKFKHQEYKLDTVHDVAGAALAVLRFVDLVDTVYHDRSPEEKLRIMRETMKSFRDNLWNAGWSRDRQG